MIFPVLKLEPTVQIDDQTRLDGSKSYADPSESDITLIRVEPETGAGFLDITESKYLDWSYGSAGTKTVTIMVTTSGFPTSETKTLDVVDAATDNLFSNDEDIVLHEPDILQWVREGRHSYLDVHRRAQDRIVGWLNEKGYRDTDRKRLSKAALVEIDEVRQWSTYMTLRLIFEGLSNAVDDQFSQKATRYQVLEQKARQVGIIQIDFDGDGVLEDGELIAFSTKGLVRR